MDAYFFPAKMWIKGLKTLLKPLLHFHTQYNAEIPWDTIDMDFMNENQSAHGGREFGFMMTRLRMNRKVVVGHWTDEDAVQSIGLWTRAAAGWHTFQTLKIARIGDNMRFVAVTEGDKVEAQMRFGFSVNGYGTGHVVEYIDKVSKAQVQKLLDEYARSYAMSNDTLKSKQLFDAAQIEIGLRAFLEAGEFEAFTNTFENLHGFNQLPGIATQRLMAEGYGFGAEGDWKTAALLRAAKVMEQGLSGGTSFMEDYTYHFGKDKSQVLGAHMLEICPSIASEKPDCELHPLGIGGKDDPARLVFNVSAGPAINISLVDMGNRFRFVINEVNALAPKQKLPKLPVARVLWQPQPSLKIAAQAWIYAGGSHHTVFSKSLPLEVFQDFAEMAGVEAIIIDKETKIPDIKKELRWNEVYYRSFQNEY